MDISSIKLYSTHEHPCSYLSDRLATTVFVDPALQLNGHIYSQLSDFGFRRSGAHVYRPHCNECQACIPVRLPVDSFVPTRAQKRCLRRNTDIDISHCTSINTDEHYQLYERYIEERHADGDMFPPNRQQYEEFLSAQWNVTHYIEMRSKHDQKLIAVAVCDHLDRGLSAIYTFFDPDQQSRSLGVFAVLVQIMQAQDLKLPYVYLGYWIRECQKMSYKTQYRPLEMFFNNQWHRFR
jgi:leucyl-tRNA---protein transferase